MKLLYSVVVLLLFHICSAQNHDDFLEPHNTERAQVGLLPLRWNKTLEAYAEKYINTRKGDCGLVHSGGPYGENLFWGSSNDFTNKAAVSGWIDEKRFYNYATNECNVGQQCGHYTQVVWRKSTDVGCARLLCDADQGVLIICSYDPPGNYIGESPY
ncbi:pathogenesis-related protein PRMS-like [Cryptomeria japonica]|uniref:pathogenesis-related protein PRMS-like n=1 Tax=Cryptomeria japonica TaxID=3369 RepID=UPI0025AD0DCB|nr:pathogenesis-related protein PRMS-like [Cryptomeria japonica]